MTDRTRGPYTDKRGTFFGFAVALFVGGLLAVGVVLTSLPSAIYPEPNLVRSLIGM